MEDTTISLWMDSIYKEIDKCEMHKNQEKRLWKETIKESVKKALFGDLNGFYEVVKIDFNGIKYKECCSTKIIIELPNASRITVTFSVDETGHATITKGRDILVEAFFIDYSDGKIKNVNEFYDVDFKNAVYIAMNNHDRLKRLELGID